MLLGHAADAVFLRTRAKRPFVRYSIQSGLRAFERLEVFATLATWASSLDPDRLQVIGVGPRDTLGAWPFPTPPSGPNYSFDSAEKCGDNHSSGACKDAIGLVKAYESGADWVVLVGSDNYVSTESLERVLKIVSKPSHPVIFGIKGCGADVCPGGLCGGAGQIFSRGALQAMMMNGTDHFLARHSEESQVANHFGDVTNCRMALSSHIPIVGLPGLHGWRDAADGLRDLIFNEHAKPLTFHYVDPRRMFQIHSMFLEQAKSSTPAETKSDAPNVTAHFVAA